MGKTTRGKGGNSGFVSGENVSPLRNTSSPASSSSPVKIRPEASASLDKAWGKFINCKYNPKKPDERRDLLADFLGLLEGASVARTTNVRRTPDVLKLCASCILDAYAEAKKTVEVRKAVEAIHEAMNSFDNHAVNRAENKGEAAAFLHNYIIAGDPVGRHRRDAGFIPALERYASQMLVSRGKLNDADLSVAGQKFSFDRFKRSFEAKIEQERIAGLSSPAQASSSVPSLPLSSPEVGISAPSASVPALPLPKGKQPKASSSSKSIPVGLSSRSAKKSSAELMAERAERKDAEKAAKAAEKAAKAESKAIISAGTAADKEWGKFADISTSAADKEKALRKFIVANEVANGRQSPDPESVNQVESFVKDHVSKLLNGQVTDKIRVIDRTKVEDVAKFIIDFERQVIAPGARDNSPEGRERTKNNLYELLDSNTQGVLRPTLPKSGYVNQLAGTLENHIAIRAMSTRALSDYDLNGREATFSVAEFFSRVGEERLAYSNPSFASYDPVGPSANSISNDELQLRGLIRGAEREIGIAPCSEAVLEKRAKFLEAQGVSHFTPGGKAIVTEFVKLTQYVEVERGTEIELKKSLPTNLRPYQKPSESGDAAEAAAGIFTGYVRSFPGQEAFILADLRRRQSISVDEPLAFIPTSGSTSVASDVSSRTPATKVRAPNPMGELVSLVAEIADEKTTEERRAALLADPRIANITASQAKAIREESQRKITFATNSIAQIERKATSSAQSAATSRRNTPAKSKESYKAEIKKYTAILDVLDPAKQAEAAKATAVSLGSSPAESSRNPVSFVAPNRPLPTSPGKAGASSVSGPSSSSSPASSSSSKSSNPREESVGKHRQICEMGMGILNGNKALQDLSQEEVYTIFPKLYNEIAIRSVDQPGISHQVEVELDVKRRKYDLFNNWYNAGGKDLGLTLEEFSKWRSVVEDRSNTGGRRVGSDAESINNYIRDHHNNSLDDFKQHLRGLDVADGVVIATQQDVNGFMSVAYSGSIREFKTHLSTIVLINAQSIDGHKQASAEDKEYAQEVIYSVKPRTLQAQFDDFRGRRSEYTEQRFTKNIQGILSEYISESAADFDSSVNLGGVDFSGFDLRGVNFSKTNPVSMNAEIKNKLRERLGLSADQDPSKVEVEIRVDFAGANLAGANLAGADLSRADNLTSKQLALAANLDGVIVAPHQQQMLERAKASPEHRAARLLDAMKKGAAEAQKRPVAPPLAQTVKAPSRVSLANLFGSSPSKTASSSSSSIPVDERANGALVARTLANAEVIDGGFIMASFASGPEASRIGNELIRAKEGLSHSVVKSDDGSFLLVLSSAKDVGVGREVQEAARQKRFESSLPGVLRELGSLQPEDHRAVEILNNLQVSPYFQKFIENDEAVAKLRSDIVMRHDNEAVVAGFNGMMLARDARIEADIAQRFDTSRLGELHASMRPHRSANAHASASSVPSSSTSSSSAGIQPPLSSMEDIVSALQNPARGGFEVTYEFFASVDRQFLAHLEAKNADVRKSLAEEEGANQAIEILIDRNKNRADRILNTLPDRVEGHAKRYQAVKKYFEEKTKELGLENPLIFFDDKALRVDVGYGPKEFQAIFPDFFRATSEHIFRGVSIFASSPVEDYMTKDYADKLDVEKRRLIQSADQGITSLSKDRVKSDLSGAGSESEIIAGSLRDNNGLVIGEGDHGSSIPKQFLIDNMAVFKAQGVTTLYMEHLLSERHQKQLDAYMKSPADAPMPKELEIYLKHLDTERMRSIAEPKPDAALFTEVVKSAKQNGIRVVAIDTEATYREGAANSLAAFYSNDTSINRYKTMNMAMVERHGQFNDGGKYIAFVGNAHVSTTQGVPGISDLLGCPNIVIYEAERGSVEKIAHNVNFDAGKEGQLNFDVVISRHSRPVEPYIAAYSSVPQPELRMTSTVSSSSTSTPVKPAIAQALANSGNPPPLPSTPIPKNPPALFARPEVVAGPSSSSGANPPALSELHRQSEELLGRLRDGVARDQSSDLPKFRLESFNQQAAILANARVNTDGYLVFAPMHESDSNTGAMDELIQRVRSDGAQVVLRQNGATIEDVDFDNNVVAFVAAPKGYALPLNPEAIERQVRDVHPGVGDAPIAPRFGSAKPFESPSVASSSNSSTASRVNTTSLSSFIVEHDPDLDDMIVHSSAPSARKPSRLQRVGKAAQTAGGYLLTGAAAVPFALGNGLAATGGGIKRTFRRSVRGDVPVVIGQAAVPLPPPPPGLSSVSSAVQPPVGSPTPVVPSAAVSGAGTASAASPSADSPASNAAVATVSSAPEFPGIPMPNKPLPIPTKVAPGILPGPPSEVSLSSRSNSQGNDDDALEDTEASFNSSSFVDYRLSQSLTRRADGDIIVSQNDDSEEISLNTESATRSFGMSHGKIDTSSLTDNGRLIDDAANREAGYEARRKFLEDLRVYDANSEKSGAVNPFDSATSRLHPDDKAWIDAVDGLWLDDDADPIQGFNSLFRDARASEFDNPARKDLLEIVNRRQLQRIDHELKRDDLDSPWKDELKQVRANVSKEIQTSLKLEKQQVRQTGKRTHDAAFNPDLDAVSDPIALARDGGSGTLGASAGQPPLKKKKGTMNAIGSELGRDAVPLAVGIGVALLLGLIFWPLGAIMAAALATYITVKVVGAVSENNAKNKEIDLENAKALQKSQNVPQKVRTPADDFADRLQEAGINIPEPVARVFAKNFLNDMTDLDVRDRFMNEVIDRVLDTSKFKPLAGLSGPQAIDFSKANAADALYFVGSDVVSRNRAAYDVNGESVTYDKITGSLGADRVKDYDAAIDADRRAHSPAHAATTASVSPGGTFVPRASYDTQVREVIGAGAVAAHDIPAANRLQATALASTFHDMPNMNERFMHQAHVLVKIHEEAVRVRGDHGFARGILDAMPESAQKDYIRENARRIIDENAARAAGAVPRGPGVPGVGAGGKSPGN